MLTSTAQERGEWISWGMPQATQTALLTGHPTHTELRITPKHIHHWVPHSRFFCGDWGWGTTTNTTANTPTASFGFFLSPQHLFGTWPFSYIPTPTHISDCLFSLVCKDVHLCHRSYGPKPEQRPLVFGKWSTRLLTDLFSPLGQGRNHPLFLKSVFAFFLTLQTGHPSKRLYHK